MSLTAKPKKMENIATGLGEPARHCDCERVAFTGLNWVEMTAWGRWEAPTRQRQRDGYPRFEGFPRCCAARLRLIVQIEKIYWTKGGKDSAFQLFW